MAETWHSPGARRDIACGYVSITACKEEPMSTARIVALALRTATLPRRAALGAALGGLMGRSLEIGSEAKKRSKRHKRRKRKNHNRNTTAANAFGCLNVGDRCDGTDLQCCSGLCREQPGGKGKARRAYCAGHDEGSCRADQDFCVTEDELATRCDGDGTCFRTTGQASFCGRLQDGNCFPCRTDAECEPVFGAGAACVVCSDCDDEAGGIGCVPPATGQPPG